MQCELCKGEIVVNNGDGDKTLCNKCRSDSNNKKINENDKIMPLEDYSINFNAKADKGKLLIFSAVCPLIGITIGYAVMLYLKHLQLGAVIIGLLVFSAFCILGVVLSTKRLFVSDTYLFVNIIVLLVNAIPLFLWFVILSDH